MSPDDEKQMNQAIELAERCRPIADRIPKVGAVVAVGGTAIGLGYRGTGNTGDDDHAEMKALNGVQDKSQLPKATVYTTLEPCTPEVRTDPLTCCTELILQAGVKKVFIGILDPNQGVRGKGLWELQDKGVEVELFPPELAKKIRVLNAAFIREQRKLGIQITNLHSGESIKTYLTKGVCKLEGTFLNPPGQDVFAFVSHDGKWWPQPYPLEVTGGNQWAVNVHIGSYGDQTLSIVRANELGTALINHYRKVGRLNTERRKKMTDRVQHFPKEERSGILNCLGLDHPGIEFTKLPKGMELQAQVGVFVERPPTESD